MSFLRSRRFLHSKPEVSKLSTRHKWPVDSELERKADLARAAMGDAHLLAKKVERKPLGTSDVTSPIDYEELPIG